MVIGFRVTDTWRPEEARHVRCLGLNAGVSFAFPSFPSCSFLETPATQATKNYINID